MQLRAATVVMGMKGLDAASRESAYRIVFAMEYKRFADVSTKVQAMNCMMQAWHAMADASA